MTTSPRKSYRKPRRPPASLRTKVGCLTCRKRRKKCDETPLTCLNCKKQAVECFWPSGHPFQTQWDHDLPHSQIGLPQSPVFQESTSPCDGFAEFRSTTTTRLAAMKVTNQDQSRSKKLSQILHPMTSTPPGQGGALQTEQQYLIRRSQYSPALTTRSALLFDFLRTTFLPQLIRPAATCRLIELFSRESLVMATQVPACMHALLACSGAEIPAQSADIQEMTQYHYAKAVAGLRESLEKQGSAKGWLVTMHTVLMLCIYERSKPRGPVSAVIHLTGAAQLIHLASQYWKTTSDISEKEHMMQRLVYESFIFHAATSLPFHGCDQTTSNIESAFSLAESHLSQYFHIPVLSHPESPVLGVAPQLFRCSFAIYRLSQSFSSTQPSQELIHGLETELIHWDRWTSAAALLDEPFVFPNEESRCYRCAHESWHQMIEKRRNAVVGPRLYLLGCRILLQRMLNSDRSRPDPVVDCLLKEGMSAVQSLQPALDYFAEYYCWPFYVLGIHLVESSDRDCLLAQIAAFWAATRNGTMKRLSEILRLSWQAEEVN